MKLKLRNLVGLTLAGAVLAGCANSDELSARFNGRWGPDPTIRAASIETVAQNQILVLGYLARNTSAAVGPDGRILASPADWYEIAQWGFNVGRQDCEIYLDNLFRMSREKGRNDNILAAATTAAAAVITGTTTAQKPLSILAAAFGLSIAINDAFFQSFLFTQAPGLVAKKVSDLQEAYRNSIEPSQITTASAAYNAIQGYYHICLPHAIEGVMLQKIADSAPIILTTSAAPASVTLLPQVSSARSASPPPRLLRAAPARRSAIVTPELQ